MVSTFRHADLSYAVRFIAQNPTRLHADNDAAVSDTAAIRAMAKRDWRMVLIAALRECGRPAPSWPDVAAVVGCSHTTAMTDFERWCALPWRDRANWLDLVERVAAESEKVSDAVP